MELTGSSNVGQTKPLARKQRREMKRKRKDRRMVYVNNETKEKFFVLLSSHKTNHFDKTMISSQHQNTLDLKSIFQINFLHSFHLNEKI
jgi:S-adenosylmethionine synthetase